MAIDFRPEPVEETETREPADTIPSGFLCNQGLLGALMGDATCSFEFAFRSSWPKAKDLGLNGNDDEEVDGELDKRLRALEKLHFFEGVLSTGGAESGI
jgi:hypothetical protein